MHTSSKPFVSTPANEEQAVAIQRRDSEPSGDTGPPSSSAAWRDPMSTISGIAAHARIADWHTLWDDPHNAGLRAHRTTPAHVQPGDAAWVPAP